MTYANGRAPESALVMVDGVHLVPTIAPRVRAFIAYAKTQGHTIHIVALGGYCNIPEQTAREHAASAGSTVSVAKPGHSTHGIYDIGRVDFVGANGHSYTPAELSWIVGNAGAFGLAREFGANDPNHFIAHGNYAGIGTAGVGIETPVTEPEEEESMYYLRYTGATPNLWIAVDDVHQQYRVIPAGGWEDKRLTDRDVAGLLVQENIGEPAWTNTFKSYTAITSGAALDPAPLVAALTAAFGKLGVTVDDAAIAKAVDAALADNFAALPGQVRAKIIAEG
jgi:hypothetical protein